jgi:hypothetical protein
MQLSTWRRYGAAWRVLQVGWVGSLIATLVFAALCLAERSAGAR